MREILHEAAAANTTRSYAAALRYWFTWFLGRYNRSMPSPVPWSMVRGRAVPRRSHGYIHGRRFQMGFAVGAGFRIDPSWIKKHPGPMALSTVVHCIAVL